MVVYLDELLLLNFTADYLLLLVTAQVCGEPLRRRRFAFIAFLGAIYAAAVEIFRDTWLSQWWMQLLFALLMVRIAFRGQGKLLRQYLLFLLISSGAAGVEMALFGFANGDVNFSGPLFLGTFALCYLLLGVTFRGSGRAAVRGLLLPVTMECGGKMVRLTALLDTGCTLSDPRSGEAVLVMERRALQPLFGEKMPAFCGELPFENLSGTGVINTYRVDGLTVGKKRLSNALIGVYEGQFSGNHQALWGGETEGSGFNVGTDMAEKMGKESGLAAAVACAVHRRERHPAATSQPGGGSGTADKAS